MTVCVLPIIRLNNTRRLSPLRNNIMQTKKPIAFAAAAAVSVCTFISGMTTWLFVLSKMDNKKER